MSLFQCSSIRAKWVPNPVRIGTRAVFDILLRFSVHNNVETWFIARIPKRKESQLFRANNLERWSAMTHREFRYPKPLVWSAMTHCEFRYPKPLVFACLSLTMTMG